MSNNNISKFCVVPWKEPYVNNIGFYGLCCMEIEEYNKEKFNINEDFQKHWNGDYIRKTRLQMLSGVSPPQCSVCVKHEAAGKNSFRQRRNLRYLHEEEPNLNNKKLQEILNNTNEDGSVSDKFLFEGFSITVGRTCQLGCISCSDAYSTYIEQEYKRLNWPQGFKDKKHIDNFNLKIDKKTFDKNLYNLLKNNIKHIKKLNISGGEPFLSKNLFEFLEWCMNEGHSDSMTLYISTNGVTLPSEKDLKNLTKFKEIFLFFSCDGIGSLEEYIRYPTLWQKKDKNLNIFKQYFKNITISSTIYSLNCHDIPNIIQYAYKKSCKVTLNLLEEPDFLHVKNLPLVYKEKIIDLLKNYKVVGNEESPWIFSHLQSIIKSLDLKDEPVNFKKIINMINSYDKLRKTNFFEVVKNFPIC